MLLDSNLIIYAGQPEHETLRGFIAREAPYVSVISKVETLGYHELSGHEKQFLEAFFEVANVLPASHSVIAEAIRLRQQRRMSLGDALIAGTALSHGLPLATHNTRRLCTGRGVGSRGSACQRVVRGLYNTSLLPEKDRG